MDIGYKEVESYEGSHGADVSNVDDDAASESIEHVTYDISSYGVDFTVDSLVSRLERGVFFVPSFQRSYVWTKPQASRFIESLLLGLPVPGIFVASQPKAVRYLVIDGQQRLKTLQYFYSGKFRNRPFRLVRVDKRWRGFTIDDLTSNDRQRLDDSIIHTTVFKQDKPRDDRSIYLVFERLNTGGSLLQAQEIRSCIHYGSFITLLGRINEDPNWRNIYGAVSKRQKDQELILRFLAFLRRSDRYRQPMRDFLNSFTADHRNIGDHLSTEFEKIFSDTIAIVVQAIGHRAFRPEKGLNAAIFDSVMVALARRIETGPVRDSQCLKQAYQRLLQDESFRLASSQSTANIDNVRSRFLLAQEAFRNVS